jgi:hypothetical protein
MNLVTVSIPSQLPNLDFGLPKGNKKDYQLSHKNQQWYSLPRTKSLKKEKSPFEEW